MLAYSGIVCAHVNTNVTLAFRCILPTADYCPIYIYIYASPTFSNANREQTLF